MKYLKSHPINESIDSDLTYDIEDILLDLNDKGIITNVYYNLEGLTPYNTHLYTVKIYKTLTYDDYEETWIDWSDIEQDVDRLIQFFESNGYNNMSMNIDGDFGKGMNIKNWIKALGQLSDYKFNKVVLRFSKTDRYLKAAEEYLQKQKGV